MMPAKAKPKSKPAKRRKPARRIISPPAKAGGKWRMSDLPLWQQVELRDRLEQANRGEGLIDFDKAIEEAERMTEEILKIGRPSKTKRSR